MTELSLESGNFGAFVRGSALYDFETEDSRHRPHAAVAAPRRTWSAATRACSMRSPTRASTSAACPPELRLGRQVLSWGESTFIQGGLNTINHFDVSALRVPGSELKEAFLPQEMAVFNLQFSDTSEHAARLPARLERHRARARRLLLQHERFRRAGRPARGARLRRLLRSGRGLQRRSAGR